jgi:hypothetical protein
VHLRNTLEGELKGPGASLSGGLQEEEAEAEPTSSSLLEHWDGRP